MMRSVKNISNSETCAESRFLKLDSQEWQGAFRTPSLRNLDKTAPFGHKGQISNLKDMIRHYNNGKFLAPVGHPNPLVMPLSLSKKEENDLLVFLKSLNSVSFYSNRDKQPRPSR
jgi:cytochrome c peroxidase